MGNIQSHKARLKQKPVSQTLSEMLTQTQAKLKETEQRFRLIFDRVGIGIAVEDLAGRIVETNPALEQMLVYTKEELRHKPLSEFTHPDDRSRESVFFRELVEGQRETYDIEKRFLRKDGQTIWVRLIRSILRGAQGEPVLGLDLVSDITQRKQAEEALKVSEKKYHDLFDNMTEAFMLGEPLFDESGKIRDFRLLEANRAFEKLTGMPLNTLIGKYFSTFFPSSPVSHNRAQRFFAKINLDKEVIIIEDYDQILDKWFSFYIYSPDRRRLAVILSNITERKKAEEALAKAKDELEIKVKERTHELAESEHKYRQLVDYASEAVVVIQEDRFQFVNNKTSEISGYSGQELLSKLFTDLVHPDDREEVFARQRELLQGKKALLNYELRIITRDGIVKWLNLNAALIQWQGKPAILCLIMDISQRKKMEQELKDYAQWITRVQEEERKRVAYELHDDTAQYLAILKMELDSLLMSGKIHEPEIIEKLTFLEKDAGRAVEDVRRYSHELRPGVLEHLGLQAALEQLAEDQNNLGQIQVVVNVEGFEPELPEDVRLGFFRVAQEAINNSRKHARASRVYINLKYEDNQVRMTVRDKGVGFDPQKVSSRIGEMENLGLMSMQERAKLIDANLSINSQPGKGTLIALEKTLEP